jgi:hypothetical protein
MAACTALPAGIAGERPGALHGGRQLAVDLADAAARRQRGAQLPGIGPGARGLPVQRVAGQAQGPICQALAASVMRAGASNWMLRAVSGCSGRRQAAVLLPGQHPSRPRRARPDGAGRLCRRWPSRRCA